MAAVHEEASPNENGKRTAIHHQSLVPRGRLARGSVPQILQYIYAPPQNRLRSGDSKQILPLTEAAAALAREHARGIPDWDVGVRVLSLERVHCNTGTVTPHRKRQIILHAEHTRRAPTPQNRRLGTGMCWDDAYVKIKHMAP